jgi:penicillin-binding protein 2
VKEGMVAVTNAIDGTAVQVFKDLPFTVAGKTGTPETGLESRGISSNGLFISYAPAENPKIAIVVVLERGVWGANAAPIARDIIKEYFGVNQKQFNEILAGSLIKAELLP